MTKSTNERRIRAAARAALLLLCVAAATEKAAAQQAGRPMGSDARVGAVSEEDGSSWYGLTVGAAGTRMTCDLCQPGRDVGPAVTVAGGAWAGPRLRVGLEASGWTHLSGDVREKTVGLGLVAHLVPNPLRGLYLLGGFGWTGYRAGDLSYDAPRVTLGAGWDVPAFGSWVVGNVVSLDASSFVPLRNEGVRVVRSVGLSAVRVAVQIRRR